MDKHEPFVKKSEAIRKIGGQSPAAFSGEPVYQNSKNAGSDPQMAADSPHQHIQQLLHRLGVTENYTGFSFTVYAVQLSIDRLDRLHLITKQLYPDVARHYGTNWKAVERNIRTVASIAWTSNPLLLSELAGFRLERRPNNARFLSILAGSCTQSIV